jgi:K+-transporting ATPase A subunit
MKKLLAASILAVLSVIVCCFCLFYVISVSDKTKDSVEKIQTDVSNMDYDAARAETEQLDEFWEYHHTMLSTVVHHGILEQIEESIALIKTSLEDISQEEQEDFQIECARSLSRIKNLRDVEVPSIGNVF